MLRFALSPTGDMRIGNLRVALFNYILSKQRNEPFIVRIEDMDTECNIEGKDKEILGILELCGIEYSNVVYQSNNLKFYRNLAVQLLQNKKAFNCFCTREEIEAEKEKAKDGGRPYSYDGPCQSLSAEETIDNENPFTVRLCKPRKAIAFEDIIKGSLSFEPDDIDAFIIMGTDKYPTSNFAGAVDDMLSDISLVIRDEDDVSRTPKQIAVREALGYFKTVEYAHLPSIVNGEGDASSVKWLLEEGFLPEAIANYLILVGNRAPQELFTLSEALEWFDLKSISNAPAKFDIEKLRFINRSHLNALDDKELSRYVGFADEAIGRLAKLFLEEVSTTKELRARVTTLFAGERESEAFGESVKMLRAIIMSAPFMDEFETFENYCMEQSGLKGEQFFRALRLVLTGAEHGPELSDVYGCIKNYLGEIVK